TRKWRFTDSDGAGRLWSRDHIFGRRDFLCDWLRRGFFSALPSALWINCIDRPGYGYEERRCSKTRRSGPDNDCADSDDNGARLRFIPGSRKQSSVAETPRSRARDVCWRSAGRHSAQVLRLCDPRSSRSYQFAVQRRIAGFDFLQEELKEHEDRRVRLAIETRRWAESPAQRQSSMRRTDYR